MDTRTLHRPLLASIALSLVAGCGLLNRETPSSAQFMLHPAPQPPKEGGSLGSVVVRRVAVQRPFDTRGFVYRTTNDQWRVDAYNAFLADPGDMFTQALTRAFESSKRFSLVSPATMSAPTDLAAESVVEEFYTDFTDAGRPVAVVRMRTYLIDRDRTKPDAGVRVVLEASASQPLASGAPRDVAEALGIATAHAIDSVVSQLPKAVAAAPAGG